MSNSLTLVYEVWNALSEEIDEANLSVAAEKLINVLIEYDHDPADIKKAFRSDSEVMTALFDYNDQNEETEEYDEYDEDSELDDEEEW